MYGERYIEILKEFTFIKKINLNLNLDPFIKSVFSFDVKTKTNHLKRLKNKLQMIYHRNIAQEANARPKESNEKINNIAIFTNLQILIYQTSSSQYSFLIPLKTFWGSLIF